MNHPLLDMEFEKGFQASGATMALFRGWQIGSPRNERFRTVNRIEGQVMLSVTRNGGDMTTRRNMMKWLVAGGSAAVLLNSCSLGKRTMRYRMTIEADTPSGPKSGSSVLEFVYPTNSGLVYGQAPYVDLGGGQYIFALIDQLSLPWGAFRYCDPPIPRDDVPYSEFDRANDLKPFAVLRREDYPKLVTFGDINDPNTVRELDPDAVKRITFQVVDHDEPLTGGIEKQFKWVTDGDHTLSGDRYGKVSGAKMLAEQLYANSFVWRAK